MGANYLSYGQVNWDLRFRAAPNGHQTGWGYSFLGHYIIYINARHPYVRSGASFPSVKGSKKANAYCSSSLAHAHNLRANSSIPVPNVPGNIPLADAPCDQSTLNLSGCTPMRSAPFQQQLIVMFVT